MIRVGFGYDVHRLTSAGPLILGGVPIPHDSGLLGHSDADVLTHAVMDALLGALALGDIGMHFPDTDPAYAGCNSIALLGKVMAMVKKRGWKVNNLDTTICAQAPRLAPFINGMRSNLARAMGTQQRLISVKATTTEGLGFVGRIEGISSYAVVSLLNPICSEAS
jgi:2-C-methyl-D-erythritol 2,4-cyclodiphosphate synthase